MNGSKPYFTTHFCLAELAAVGRISDAVTLHCVVVVVLSLAAANDRLPVLRRRLDASLAVLALARRRSCVNLSCRTNTPWWLRQRKYRTPFTVPSFLPANTTHDNNTCFTVTLIQWRFWRDTQLSCDYPWCHKHVCISITTTDSSTVVLKFHQSIRIGSCANCTMQGRHVLWTLTTVCPVPRLFSMRVRRVCDEPADIPHGTAWQEIAVGPANVNTTWLAGLGSLNDSILAQQMIFPANLLVL